MTENANQVKSKKRVADHGEVFTADREVNAMLDLVKDETERIDSRFLEPACGNGNFLAEVLRRKLSIVKKRYGKSPSDYERNAFLAVSSIYGVELLSDNAEECRERLFNILNEEYVLAFKKKTDDIYSDSIRYVLERNILCGDALTLKRGDGEPIIFSEWNMVSGNMVSRRDYRLDQLLEAKEEQISISMLGWEYDNELKSFIPSPIKEYPLIDYRKVREHADFKSQ
ncbi:MAG: SAM-dependent DNA methyltransferase [Trichococcus flocculiformis]|uniref:SAM-dependent DNA methyltransferase n=1 Tax=Trichococcus flocculiformis TaxID=82803 RepID=A0A847D3F3_9LACT|nr:methylase [Trichococcus flocculiformis]NLD31135.1 SAM-dependent DNA methyltransferase [Trichococcus flocculiformis]